MPRRKLLTRDTAFLNRIGSRDTVMSSMRTAAADQSVTYKRLRTQMEGALNRLTHTLTEKKGVLLMRTADGKLDNPYGGPACLMPNGQAAWALSGQRMDQKRYQTALARSEVARARTISREPPDVSFVVTKLAS